ncbi:MAG TPA: hypothetical protein PK992_08050 [Planctomycetaceae bacterium]|nr:hypothetical protein [Planctomycetaceae bacterium]
MTDRIPQAIQTRVFERPDVFRVVAGMSDQEMDKFLKQFGKKGLQKS